jgi:hypothetical protein
VPARAWPWMWSWWPATATAALNRNRNLSTGRRLVGLPAQAVAPGAAGQAGGRARRDPCGRDRRAQRRATPHRTESARWREGPVLLLTSAGHQVGAVAGAEPEILPALRAPPGRRRARCPHAAGIPGRGPARRASTSAAYSSGFARRPATPGTGESSPSSLT